MPRKIVRLNLSDSIAQYVANQTMIKLAWCLQPELMQRKSVQLIESGDNHVKLLIEYPLHRVPSFVYKVAVSLIGGEGSWFGGHVYALHGSVQELCWKSEFSVIDRPADELSEFENDIVVEVGDFIPIPMNDASRKLFNI